MPDGPPDLPPVAAPRGFAWTEIFRSFQVALDPRKLLLAAAGILAMSLGWYVLSAVFYQPTPPQEGSDEYGVARMQKALGANKPGGGNYTEDEYRAEGRRRYHRDYAEWRTLHDLAGPGGRLRTLPWNEYRGPNPFLLFQQAIGGSSVDLANAGRQFLTGTVPVLIEPLAKLLLPVVRLLDPNAGFGTRVYLVLALLWSVAVWAFFGGVITRIAAVQFAGRERVTLPQAVRYVVARYPSYALSPLVPIGVIFAIIVALAVYGFVALVPILGDVVLYGLGFPLVIVGGIAMAVLLVGLIGYPLMYTTVSAEGSDTFDALSRSYNYVFQAPWHYLWYGLVAVLYGAAVVFFVVFMGSLMVYMGKYAVSQAPLSEYTGRKPDFLFTYAPESFGWKEVLLKGSPIEVVEQEVSPPGERKQVAYVHPERLQEAANGYRNSYSWWNYAGAGLVTFWLVLVFLLMIGFSYSYFWSAATMVYLLMRRKVDETELDEVYVEEELPESPVGPPAGGPAAPAAGGATALPVIPPQAPASVGVAAPTPPPPVPVMAPPALVASAGVAAPPGATVSSETVRTTTERIDLKPGEQVTIPPTGPTTTTAADLPAGGGTNGTGGPAPKPDDEAK